MYFSYKLVALLTKFSKHDLNRFYKLVHSPYFNEQEEISILYRSLHPLLKEGPAALESLTKEEVAKAVWPDMPFNDSRLRHLASDLTRLALRFLVLKEREMRPWEDLPDLQVQLQDPALKKHSDSIDRQLEELLDSKQHLGSHHYLSGFRIHRTWYGQATQSGRKSDSSTHLAASEYHLDVFYVIQKLKLYEEWLTLKATRHTEKGFSEPEGFWQQAQKFRDVPLVSLYLTIIQCLENMEEEGHFFDLLNLLEQLGTQLTDQDRREGYQTAQNYCAFKINSGKTTYYEQMFRVYQKMLETNLLLENGLLPEGYYKNIITCGLRTGAFAWVEQFINEYSALLPVPLRENARTFNLANLYSHQKQHRKVIELLQNVEYSDVMYALSSKVILIRTYYDLGEYLSLESLLESFRIYIRRNRLISNNLKAEYIKFVNFVRQLTRLDTYDKAQLARLRQKVTAATSATPKKWLIEKIEALEQGKRRKGTAS
jgi:hypothetical protein